MANRSISAERVAARFAHEIKVETRFGYSGPWEAVDGHWFSWKGLSERCKDDLPGHANVRVMVGKLVVYEGSVSRMPEATPPHWPY